MVRPGHRTHHPLPARAILSRDPARRTAQPTGTRGRYERGLVSQTPPHLQRHTRRCAATFLAGTGFCHVSPSRRGEETPPSAPGRHYLCALPRCLMAKVELKSDDKLARIQEPANRIYVCRNFLTETPIQQVSALVHELAHFVSGNPILIGDVVKVGRMLSAS